MKKMKRFFALFLAMAMVLGMSMTTFAEQERKATITVQNLQEGTTVKYARLIKPNPKTKTGWDFSNEEIENVYVNAYKTATKSTTATGQDVLAALANLTTSKQTGISGDAVAYVTDETWVKSAISQASAKVEAKEWKTASNPSSWTVEEAGIYVVKPVKESYNYLAMAAYVGFGEVKNADGEVTNAYPSLMDVILGAKGSAMEVIKTNQDSDGVVAIGSEIEYQVVTNVPYIEVGATNNTNQPIERNYVIVDNIKGAKYVGYPAESPIGTNLTGVTVKFKNGETTSELPTGITPTVKVVEAEDGYDYAFELDLSGLIDEGNTYAGQQIIITYKANVEKVTVENKAAASNKQSEGTGLKFGEDDDKVFTGLIELVKYGDKEKTIKLADAGFHVKKDTGTKDSDGNIIYSPALPFKETVTGVKGDYTYDPNGENSITEVFTAGADGKVVVRGLDIDKPYIFEEVTAPTGYSKNAEGSIATFTAMEAGKKAVDTPKAETDMIDTTLSALPSTGGIGTTIFTVGGCAIMILAAGMFFVSRRKASR